MALYKPSTIYFMLLFSLQAANCATQEKPEAITDAKVEVDAGSITINRSDNNKANTDKSVKTGQISGEGYSAEYSAYNTHPDDKIEMFVTGRVLRILFKKAQQNSHPSAHVDFRLQVPSNCCIDITGGSTDVYLQDTSNIRTNVGYGNITMQNILGNINIMTGTGSVSISNCLKALKNIQQYFTSEYLIKTGCGRININNPLAQKIITSTGSGNIDMQNIATSEVNAKTGFGNIGASYADNIKKSSFNFSTGSGNVNIQLPHSLKVAQKIISRNVKTDFANIQDNPDLTIKGNTGLGAVHINRK